VFVCDSTRVKTGGAKKKVHKKELYPDENLNTNETYVCYKTAKELEKGGAVSLSSFFMNEPDVGLRMFL